MSEIVVGTVSAFHRYPVKSMLGEELEAVALDQRGVVGDRLYALVDQETGKTGTPYPCAGVYADVLAEGEIRCGDPVRLIA